MVCQQLFHSERHRPFPAMQSVHLGHISRCCPSGQHRSSSPNLVSTKSNALIKGSALLSVASRQRFAGDRPSICHAVINHEASTADSWALSNRAAMLSLNVEQLNEYIQSNSGAHAWLAVCEPERECGHDLSLFTGSIVDSRWKESSCSRPKLPLYDNKTHYRMYITAV